MEEISRQIINNKFITYVCILHKSFQRKKMCILGQMVEARAFARAKEKGDM